jgi:large subunit ribosomal protein L7/L12
MTDLAKIVDDLSKLTVLEAADLSKMLEEKWGVSPRLPWPWLRSRCGRRCRCGEEQTEFAVISRPVVTRRSTSSRRSAPSRVSA